MGLPRWLVLSVVMLVAGLWALNVVAGIFYGRGVEGLNWVFGLIVGGALASDQRIGRGIRSVGRTIGGMPAAPADDPANGEDKS